MKRIQRRVARRSVPVSDWLWQCVTILAKLEGVMIANVVQRALIAEVRRSSIPQVLEQYRANNPETEKS